MRCDRCQGGRFKKVKEAKSTLVLPLTPVVAHTSFTDDVEWMKSNGLGHDCENKMRNYTDTFRPFDFRSPGSDSSDLSFGFFF
jgi:hypothetical protein